MTPPAAPTTLEAAERDLAELERDLATLRDALAAHEAELNAARRSGKAPAKLAELGTRAASLRLLVADQKADVQAARATVERLRAEHEHAEREATIRATHAELAALRTEYGEALTAAVLAVSQAFASARAIRERWIATRARAADELTRHSIPLAATRSDDVARARAALRALDLDPVTFTSAPDEAAPLGPFPTALHPAHYPVPAALTDRARALSLTRHPAFPNVPAKALLAIAADAAAHPFREAPPS